MSVSITSLKKQLSDLAVASHEATSPPILYEACASALTRALGADFAGVLEYLNVEGAFLLRSARGFPEELTDRERVPSGLLSQAGRAFLDPLGRTVEFEDASCPREWTVASDPLVRRGARSGIAIRVDEGGRPFGVIGAFYAAVRTFSSEEQEFLSQAARLLGAGLRRLRSEREAASWRSRSDLLRSGAALLRVPAKRDSVLLAAAAAGVGGERPMADWCVADALETDGRLPVLIGIGFARARGSTQRLEHKISVPLAPAAQHGSARVYATRQPELVRECDESIIRTVFSESEHRGEIDAARPCSYVCVPVVGSHRFYGAMGFIRTEHGNPTPFDEEDVTVCSEFTGLVATAIERGEPEPDIAEAEEAVRTRAGVADFTDRELEVLLGIAAGERLAQIGRNLSISIHTVRNHKRSLCAKLGLAPSVPDARIIAEARRCGVPNLST